MQNAPSDYILIGRYVLTPDVFDEIERLTPGSGGELQLTDALRAQADGRRSTRVLSPRRPLRHRHTARFPRGGDRVRASRPEHGSPRCATCSDAFTHGVRVDAPDLRDRRSSSPMSVGMP